MESIPPFIIPPFIMDRISAIGASGREAARYTDAT
jgi:hypothetical protein